ncbi:hypothetical protein WISP_70746 [Willisornis vidua]|uniref:Uncharacterized protein n=1 Tax=Willisornis vidua TaxID=1566151 RepID=A0ABQ9D7K9_9PASS|nr:hypothetical protein WISP_70746 [Willisornis vidua]
MEVPGRAATPVARGSVRWQLCYDMRGKTWWMEWCLALCQLHCGSGKEHKDERPDPAPHDLAVGSCHFQGKRLD